MLGALSDLAVIVDGVQFGPLLIGRFVGLPAQRRTRVSNIRSIKGFIE